MVGQRCFADTHTRILSDAVVIAEEMTSDYYKLSRSQWLKSRYDILTLPELREDEISPHALAQVARYSCIRPGGLLKSDHFDLYRICLQDHNIIDTLENCRHLELLPLLIYVVTHELVHVVRFSRFQQLFDVTPEEKAQEERRVHQLAETILEPITAPPLREVLAYYREHPEVLNA